MVTLITVFNKIQYHNGKLLQHLCMCLVTCCCWLAATQMFGSSTSYDADNTVCFVLTTHFDDAYKDVRATDKRCSYLTGSK